MKKAYIIALLVPILIITIYSNWRNIQIKWVEIFKIDSVFIDYYSEDELDGTITWYVRGKIFATGRQKDGVKNGVETSFYDNGLTRSKTLFVNGQPSEKGLLYARTGKLLYSGNYRNGRRYGNWYSYHDNGQVKEYLMYDIYQHIAFRLNYDKKGKIDFRKMSGMVVSPCFYSIDTVRKNIITMGNRDDTEQKFADVRDLYIVVANAPHTSLTVKVRINSLLYTFKNIKTGTLKIPRVFNKKGSYNFFVESHMYDENNKAFNGVNIKYSIEKIL